VIQRYRVTFDSSNSDGFTVHKDDGIIQFKLSGPGLWYSELGMRSNRGARDGNQFVETVADNRASYSAASYSRACLARKLQITMGRPSTRGYIGMVENRLLPNCPITEADILAAEQILGPDVGSLKSKTVRRTPKAVTMGNVPVPDDILRTYRRVTMGADVMYVNKIPFLVTSSGHLHFGTAKVLVNLKHSTILNAIKGVQSVYGQRGFMIDWLLLDGGFAALRNDVQLSCIKVYLVAKDEHVPEVERYIRTVKEWVRYIWQTLPFHVDRRHWSLAWLEHRYFG
jgi:hypothetical protein